MLRALRELLQYHGFRLEAFIGSGFMPFPVLLARMLVRFLANRADIITVKVHKNYAGEAS